MEHFKQIITDYLTTNYITDCLNCGNEWLYTYKMPKKVYKHKF